MFRSKMIVAGGATLAVAVGGVAIADAAGGTGTQVTDPPGHHMHRGFARARLTHGDVHLFVKGRDLDIRIDRGVLQAIGSDSITLHELDGSDVTIPVDSGTRVLKMARPATLSDLHTGDVAFTAREAGKPARLVRSPGHPPRAGRRGAH